MGMAQKKLFLGCRQYTCIKFTKHGASKAHSRPLCIFYTGRAKKGSLQNNFANY